MKKIISFGLLLVLCLGLFACAEPPLEEADLVISFLKTGKSDAILIKIGSTSILIDTGYATSMSEIDNALEREGVERLDYLILTHFDKDHIGSAPTLLTRYEVGQVYMPNFTVDTDEYRTLITTLASTEVPCTRLDKDTTLTLPEGATLRVSPTLLTPTDDNNQSLICALNWDDFGCLFLADALKDRLEEYWETDTATYDVVKLPHHGNYYKKLEGYLQVVSPTYGIVCCGEEREVEEQLITMCRDLGITLLRTDEGAIRLTFDRASGTYQFKQA